MSSRGNTYTLEQLSQTVDIISATQERQLEQLEYVFENMNRITRLAAQQLEFQEDILARITALETLVATNKGEK